MECNKMRVKVAQERTMRERHTSNLTAQILRQQRSNEHCWNASASGDGRNGDKGVQ
jgi:hypothetical protein